MTDDDGANHTIKIGQWLEEKGVSWKCSCCGSERWSVVNFGADSITTIPVTGSKSSTPVFLNRHLPVYTLFCNNCGFVRMHAKVVCDENLIVQDDGDTNEMLPE